MSKHRNQLGFFDVADRLAKLGEKGEPLLRLNALVKMSMSADEEEQRDALRLQESHQCRRGEQAGAKLCRQRCLGT